MQTPFPHAANILRKVLTGTTEGKYWVCIMEDVDITHVVGEKDTSVWSLQFDFS